MSTNGAGPELLADLGGSKNRLTAADDAVHPATRSIAVADWWSTYFDHQYLREYEPLFTLERDRQEVARLIEVLGLHAGAQPTMNGSV